MSQKNSWKDYFSLSKKDRNAFVFTLIIIGVVIAAPFLYNRNKKNENNTGADSALAKLPAKNIFFEKENEESFSEITNEKLFTFDPNTLDLQGWLSLGIGRKTANTIINYTSKGGRFKTAEDIRKIWGLKKDEADKLIPFIRIENNNNTVKKISGSYMKKSVPTIDINSATAAEFNALPGIGNVLSNRIVKYRNSIKAFNSIDDIRKVYGISDAAFQTIRPFLKISGNTKTSLTSKNTEKQTTTEKGPAKTANINTASEKEMTAIGIPRNVAKAIIVYRQQNGNYNTIEDIKKIIFINREIYEKVAPLMTTK